MTAHLWLPRAAAVPSPDELAAYLRQERWELRSADATWANYSKEVKGELVELEVPQQAAAPDFARAVGLLIDDLARLEERMAMEVLRDVGSSSLDIVRLAIEGSSTRDGRIAVEAGRRVYGAARDLLLAAACSVIDPRPVFTKRKPDEAMSLLGRARFGQTEVGSFVMTMECLIPPRLQPALFDEDVDAPFERKVSLRLADALHAAAGASRESAASNRIEPFRERAKDGVSANLCEAIAEMLDATSADALKARFSFATRRPLGRRAPPLVAFSSDTVPILREAAARLRDEASYPATEVAGTVVKLDSPDPAVGGDAVLRVDWEGRMRPVRISLDAAAYRQALAAHGDRSLVHCTGELTREGRSWVLRNARDFAIHPEQDDP